MVPGRHRIAGGSKSMLLLLRTRVHHSLPLRHVFPGRKYGQPSENESIPAVKKNWRSKFFHVFLTETGFLFYKKETLSSILYY